MLNRVTQGCVLLPMLFNICMKKLPLPPKDLNISSYAEDATSTTSQPPLEKLSDIIITYLITLYDWLQSRKIKLSAENSKATLFTTPITPQCFKTLSTNHQSIAWS